MKILPIINSRGSIFPLTIIALTSILVLTVVLVSSSFTYKQSSKYSLDNLEAGSLAEAGVEKAVAALNQSGGSYGGELETVLGGGTYSVKITDIDPNTKKVESTGYLPNKAEAKARSTASVMIQKGAGLSFAYGIQAGDGGFNVSGGSRVTGSVYSNNDISVSGGGTITGDAYVAAGTSPTADVQHECAPAYCTDYLFGKSVSGQNRLDVAQSFQPQIAGTINKVALRLKKFGTPSNAIVKIMTNNNGKPSKTSLASGSLSANLVTGQYGYIDVGFDSNPTLTLGTTYWLLIDTSADNNSNNYWSWSQDSLGTYNQGSPSFSPNWSAGNPSWTGISGDLDFKTFMGGDVNKLIGNGSGYVNGNAYANTMTADNSSALQIGGDAYYQTQSGITVRGQNCNSNSHCHPGSTDPPPLNLPVSQANIDEWKDVADGPNDDNVHNGDLTIQWPCTTTLEKKKYVGNVTVQGGCNIQIESPIWITGNLNVTGGSTVRLNTSYGSTSGVVVVDGRITLDGGSRFLGSGASGSYLMGLSTYNSPTTPAITVSGGNSSSIVYAPFGVINLQGGTNLREATAWKITLTGGSNVTYETGVASPFFSSGPQGSFSVVKGSYQFK